MGLDLYMGVCLCVCVNEYMAYMAIAVGVPYGGFRFWQFAHAQNTHNNKTKTIYDIELNITCGGGMGLLASLLQSMHSLVVSGNGSMACGTQRHYIGLGMLST